MLGNLIIWFTLLCIGCISLDWFLDWLYPERKSKNIKQPEKDISIAERLQIKSKQEVELLKEKFLKMYEEYMNIINTDIEYKNMQEEKGMYTEITKPLEKCSYDILTEYIVKKFDLKRKIYYLSNELFWYKNVYPSWKEEQKEREKIKEELRLKKERKLALNHNIKHAKDDKKKRKYMRFIVKRKKIGG